MRVFVFGLMFVLCAFVLPAQGVGVIVTNPLADTLLGELIVDGITTLDTITDQLNVFTDLRNITVDLQSSLVGAPLEVARSLEAQYDAYIRFVTEVPTFDLTFSNPDSERYADGVAHAQLLSDRNDRFTEFLSGSVIDLSVDSDRRTRLNETRASSNAYPSSLAVQSRLTNANLSELGGLLIDLTRTNQALLAVEIERERRAQESNDYGDYVHGRLFNDSLGEPRDDYGGAILGDSSGGGGGSLFPCVEWFGKHCLFSSPVATNRSGSNRVRRSGRLSDRSRRTSGGRLSRVSRFDRRGSN